MHRVRGDTEVTGDISGRQVHRHLSVRAAFGQFGAALGTRRVATPESSTARWALLARTLNRPLLSLRRTAGLASRPRLVLIVRHSERFGPPDDHGLPVPHARTVVVG